MSIPTLSEAVQAAIAPVVDEAISQQIKKYLSSEELAVYVQSQVAGLLTEFIDTGWQPPNGSGAVETEAVGEVKPKTTRKTPARKASPAAKAETAPVAKKRQAKTAATAAKPSGRRKAST